jgi:RNA polymerase sigma-70 factor (ECF subfamily)
VAQSDLANLYARHRQGLFTHALLITRSVEAAEDAVHDAFARMCARPPPPDLADPVAYAFVAVRAAAIDQCRRARVRRDAPAPLVSIFADDGGPAHDAQESERCQWVQAALERLAPEEREAIVLRFYAGLAFHQIAQVTGEPLATVASRYRRSLAKLRPVLEKVV